MSNTQQPRTFIEPKIINRLTLWAPDPSSTTMERANMTHAEKGSNLEILVWAKGPGDVGKAPIRANLNIRQILMYTKALNEAADTTGEYRMDLPIKNGRRVTGENGKETTEVYDQATLRVARNSAGYVVIALLDKDETRSRILFPLELDRWSGNLIRNGVPLTVEEMSGEIARGYARILEHHFLNRVEALTRTENSQTYPREGAGAPKKPVSPKASSGFDNGFDDISY